MLVGRVPKRVGRVLLLPYTHPGSADVRPLVLANHAAAPLENHGPVVSGRTFREAAFAAEELEETAKLVLLTIDAGAASVAAGDR